MGAWQLTRLRPHRADRDQKMPTSLPPPASTTDVLLLALIERVDAIVAALPESRIQSITAPVAVVAPPPPSPRKRAPKPKDAP